MRATAAVGGTQLKAYAGTSGVLLAWNVEPDKRDGLLGFAIERKVGDGAAEWLTGSLDFEGAKPVAGSSFPSNQRPFQRFRWSDYRVHPDTAYAYTVHPVYGTPDEPKVEPGPEVRVRSAADRGGRHTILFNRAAAASQAFSKKFPEVERELDAARLTPLAEIPRLCSLKFPT